MIKNIESIINEIFDLYEKYGDSNYSGEAVSQYEHAFQAADLAIIDGFDNEVIIAAFLHDIAHLFSELNEDELYDIIGVKQVNSMGDYGVTGHEGLAAKYLSNCGFSEKVTYLIQNHVNAKRYLVFKNPGYYNGLSIASKETLEYQGGRMSEAEANRFDQHPLFELSIKLREYDEKAKVENLLKPEIEKYKSIALSVLNSYNSENE